MIVAALWERYELAAVPSKLSPLQRLELRRSFYAGVLSQLQLQKGGSFAGAWTPEHTALEAECRVLLSWVAEGVR